MLKKLLVTRRQWEEILSKELEFSPEFRFQETIDNAKRMIKKITAMIEKL